MTAFGFVRRSEAITEGSRLIHSDWHSSIFENSERKLIIICGFRTDVLNISAKCLCSNSKFIFILKSNGIIIIYEKDSGLIREFALPSCRFIVANDEKLLSITKDDFLQSRLVSDFEKEDLERKTFSPLSMKIRTMACGAGFALYLTFTGIIFSEGIGSRGQLGHGDLESRNSPEIVEALQPIIIVSIACGFWHSACLSDTGDVYTWGSNEYGQLGVPSLNLERSRNRNNPLFFSDSCSNVHAVPVLVDFPNESSIVSISCGSRHTACLSNKNEIFTFGWNGAGQLGYAVQKIDSSLSIGHLPHLTATDKPHRIALDWVNPKNIRIFCGQWSTIISNDNTIAS